MEVNKKFKKLCKDINKKCIELQDIEKEYIEHELAFEAYIFISQMKLELPGDFLLFISALNLLNTYVKQKDSKINYKFKNEIDYFLEACLRKSKDVLKINKDADEKGKLLIIQINDLQFSFHSVKCKYEGIDQNITADIEWDGIRKQLCAVTLYNLCKENQLLRCNKTFRGANLNNKVNRFVDNFKKGTINFDSKF